jgi:toxin ParE1/3/4
VPRRDLLQHFAYLEEQAGIEVAHRFLTAVTDTAEALARMPHMASVYGFQRPSLRRVRRWPVRGFENWLIFYLPKRDGVDIVRVIHGSRDIASVLGDRQI